MRVYEQSCSLPAAPSEENLIAQLQKAVKFRLADGAIPNRFSVTESTATHFECEVGVVEGGRGENSMEFSDVFSFKRRTHENTEKFNVALIVPTGIGCEIGGHAGDATPVVRLLAGACDTLLTHPNVVNASDLNEMPDNTLYVEGSILTRLFMGTVALQPVRSNRVLVVIDEHQDENISNMTVNAVNAARTAYGLNCPKVVKLHPPVEMTTSYNASGRAAGEVSSLDGLVQVLTEEQGNYDAVALSSVIQVPFSYHQGYFDSKGEMINPWGGVEALLTHTISSFFDVPSAHSPMFESAQVANMTPGIVDPRMAAEAISVTFFQCILKGLHKSPRVVTGHSEMNGKGILTANDLSCLIIPDGCLGLPTLAALEQGIPVIAVRENKNLMKNDLTSLPWAVGQLTIVENYWEAAGVMLALKTGVAPETVRRPISYVEVETRRMSETQEQLSSDQERA